jgi:para-aminobenzoate synthetase/4-amino-4-deoxychorismate lyase
MPARHASDAIRDAMLGDACFLSLAGDATGWRRGFSGPHWVDRAHHPQDVAAVLDNAAGRARDGEWVVLALAYEAAPAFDPNLAVHAPSPAPICFAAAYAAPTPAAVIPPATRPFSATPWRPLVSREDYGRALADIRENIRQGEAYQVNYTFPLASRFTGDPAAWFGVLARGQAAGYCCRLDLGREHILSFSPELFLSRQGETVTVRPMKGTMPRGRTPQEDAALAAALAACPKNQAENRMITDLMRNDLGRIARPGTVDVSGLFAVERLGTAWQMTSTVSARVPRETDLAGLLAALFPCGSITGAPKQSAMSIIRRLEPYPRGFYTGALGHIAPGGDCTLAVAIRTVVLDTRTGRCRFGVGGGVTHYSREADEYEECRIKARFLTVPAEPFELLETLRLDGGRYAFLPAHLARLEGSAAYYGFRHDARAIEAALLAVRQAHPRSRRRVRLLVSRDGSARAESFPLGARPNAPLRLGLAGRLVEADDPAFYHKTTRRELYDRALAAQPACDDVVLCNTRGQATESCRANIVIERHGRLLTPALACGLLPGTFREQLLARGVITEAVLTPDDLAAATRLWLINSVRLWMPAVLASSGPAED